MATTCSRCSVPWAHLHVTEAVALSGLIDVTHFTDQGRQRGIYVHEACRLFDKGTLDWESLDPQLLPYLEAYRDFSVFNARYWVCQGELAMKAISWTHVEYPVTDPILGYVGTLDRASDDVVLDIKSGPAQWWVAVQVAAYRRCLQDGKRRKQFVLELRDDGTYRYTPTADLSGLSDRDAEKLWLSVLDVARARKAHTS